MTQDEFRAAMNAAKKAGRLLTLADDNEFGIAVGYDSGTDEAVLHGGKRIPLAGAHEINLHDSLNLGPSVSTGKRDPVGL